MRRDRVMGYTIAEKILGRTSEAGVPVSAGSQVEVKPDYVLGYDFPGYLDLIFKQMKEEFGIERVAEPERFALFIDLAAFHTDKHAVFTDKFQCSDLKLPHRAFRL